jgi:hypothetical protein
VPRPALPVASLVLLVVLAGCLGPVGGEGTETIHADYRPWTVRYDVGGDSVLRTELD